MNNILTLPANTLHSVGLDSRQLATKATFLRPVAALFNLLLVWQARISDREALTAMPEYQRADIGLSRTMIQREAAKPFWSA